MSLLETLGLKSELKVEIRGFSVIAPGDSFAIPDPRRRSNEVRNSERCSFVVPGEPGRNKERAQRHNDRYIDRGNDKQGMRHAGEARPISGNVV